MKKSLLILLIACATPAYAIQPYQAQQIEVYRGGSIEPYQAEAVKPEKARKVKPQKAESVTPYRAETIRPYQADAIQPYQAETIKPYRADSIEPYRGESVQPEQAQRVQPNRGTQVNGAAGNPAPAQGGNLPQQDPSTAKKKGSATQAAKGLVGVWQTNVPGAVYTTPSGLTGYDILHVSSGAAAGLLRINANGTYSWNSYGGKKGKWITTSDPEYPIVIIDTVENRRWRVGYSAAKGTLYVWDGSIWYEGRKATVKK